MDTFVYPSTIEYVPGELHSATLTIEPLFHGYGTTIGNALRRVLLSSLPGGALTGVKIAGVSHEFTTMKGVKEDGVEIRMNLKQVALKVFSNTPVRLYLSKKGKGPVTAGDFTANADVEIVNPHIVIATLTDDATTFEL
ncbi:TPA: DNA-directed RNA polymerase subunit alpha, partial [Candidatus Uhrbacteria bacterium]|nr:DNA-directed RNA polymerase subunit alpha [Candidatus Uhrbacteria bacterium]